MFLSGDQIHRCSTAGIKMCHEVLSVRIDSHQYSLMLRLSLENTLLIGQEHRTKGSVIQCLGMLLGLCQSADPVAQAVPLRLVKAGAQCRVTIFFSGFEAPFASIVDTGNPRHAECHGIDQGQVIFIVQNACHAGHIVVIHERQQVFSLIQCPVLRSELAQQRMHDLEHVHAVEAAVKSLIALVVRRRM